MMLKCWEATPDDRPSFEQLYKEIFRYTECIAGYLKLEYNPFGGVVGIDAASEENEPQNEENEIQSAMSLHVIPPLVDT